MAGGSRTFFVGASPRGRRDFAWFDCLRSAAVLLVLLAHAGDLSVVFPVVTLRAMQNLQAMAWVGVDLFFVLSGFLVSGLLFDEHARTGGIDLERFLIRRALKIVPPFYFLIAVTALHDGWTARGINLTHLFHDLFFLQNYRAGAWSHAWTLALEVHFYLLLAWLLWFLSRRTIAVHADWLRPLPAIMVAVLVLSFFARWLNSGLREGDFNLHRELEPSHLHLDVLASGVLLRYLYERAPRHLSRFRRPAPLWLALASLLIIPSGMIWSPHSALLTALVPTANSLGFGLLLYQAARSTFPSAGAARLVLLPLDYLGKHSYSVYLWHLPVRQWLVLPLFPQPTFATFVFYVIASLAIGTLFSVVLEMPVLAVRNRLFPSRATESRRGTKP